MKKIIPIALAVILLLCTIVGCSSKSSARDRNDAAESKASYNAAYEYEPEPEYAPEPGAVPNGFNGDSSVPDASAALSNRKIIRNADMTVETLSFDTFTNQLAASVGAIGGYVESSSVSNRPIKGDRTLRYARYTIRIPAEQLDAFLNTVSGLGNVTSMNTGLKDVTTNYVDSEKHLEALRTEQAALLEILAKADTVEDIIKVQDRLTYVSYEIESYEAVLRTYDDQIALSSVTLSVSEVERETPVEEETFGQEVSRRFGESMEDLGNGFRNFAAGFLGNAPIIIVILLFFVCLPLIIVLLCVRGARKRRAKKREAAIRAKQEAEAKAVQKSPEA